MSGGLLSLKWNNHRTTFFEVLSHLRKKADYSDVSIACDGKLYHVHKLILSTCSEYFEEMFSQVESKHPIIVLKDIKGDELEALLNYMYLGEVNVLQNDLPGLIKAAECLRIKGLAIPDEPPDIDDSTTNKRLTHRIEESPQPKRRKTENNDIRPNLIDLPKMTINKDSSDSCKDNVDSYSDSSNPITSVPKISRLSNEETEENGDVKTTTSSETSDADLFLNRLSEPEVVLDEASKVKPEPGDEDEEREGDMNIKEEEEEDEESLNDPSAFMSLQIKPEKYLAGSSGIQPNFGMWEGEGSLQGFPPEGFPTGEGGPHSQQMVQRLYMQYLMNYYKEVQNQSTTPDQKEVDKGEKKSFTCEYCGRIFVKKTLLTRHIRIHTGEKPFGCTHCPYKASRPDTLKSHIEIKHRKPTTELLLHTLMKKNKRQQRAAASRGRRVGNSSRQEEPVPYEPDIAQGSVEDHCE